MVWVPSTRIGKLEHGQEGLAEMKPVIGESGGIEDVHHLRLMTLLIELVWDKATVLKVKRNEQRMWKSCRARASDA